VCHCEEVKSKAMVCEPAISVLDPQSGAFETPPLRYRNGIERGRFCWPCLYLDDGKDVAPLGENVDFSDLRAQAAGQYSVAFQAQDHTAEPFGQRAIPEGAALALCLEPRLSARAEHYPAPSFNFTARS